MRETTGLSQKMKWIQAGQQIQIQQNLRKIQQVAETKKRMIVKLPKMWYDNAKLCLHLDYTVNFVPGGKIDDQKRNAGALF
ncbi:MAG: hypothetical protein Q4F28_05275 [Eubacteriales bacterium]|nr:hypothetical protein [Eubacteriales bacterium]